MTTPQEVFNRIIDVINSCTTLNHVDSSINMIRNAIKTHGKEVNAYALIERAKDKAVEIYNKKKGDI